MAKNRGGSGYAGKIGNAAGQEVKAIYPAQHGKTSKVTKVTKGNDLRTGKGKK